jgi:hypothetical protein
VFCENGGPYPVKLARVQSGRWACHRVWQAILGLEGLGKDVIPPEVTSIGSISYQVNAKIAAANLRKQGLFDRDGLWTLLHDLYCFPVPGDS